MRSRLTLLLASTFAVGLYGCSSDDNGQPPQDDAATDASSSDGPSGDSAPTSSDAGDAAQDGARDSGVSDGGVSDGGVSDGALAADAASDAAKPSDGGPDAAADGSRDASSDAGADVNSVVDSGSTDSGSLGLVDSGKTDASVDSGSAEAIDSGVDAGLDALGAVDGGLDATLDAGGDAAVEAGEAGEAGEADDAGPLAAVSRVLLLSVDGLHEADLAQWVAANPNSALAGLAASGIQYTDAHTTTPSDSFPGMLSFVTGGTPKSTGVYYDDSYDRTLYAPGSQCGISQGTEVLYDESIDRNKALLFSGGIDANNLPRSLSGEDCEPVYPHQFLKVNTIFELVSQAGGYTAWSDKHPAYEILGGPSGLPIADLYTPEINSLVDNGGTVNGVNLVGSKAACNSQNALATVTDYTTCEPTVAAYDQVKVMAVINEIQGKTSDGAGTAPVPTLFGMNFQDVSVAEKLPVGGYTGGAPSALLTTAIKNVDDSIGRMVAELKRQNLFSSTLVIVSAKHGQAPIDKTQLHTIGGLGTGDVTDPASIVAAQLGDAGIDTPFTDARNMNAYATHGHLQTDDVGILWLQDQSTTSSVAAALTSHAAEIEANILPPGTVFPTNITSGAALAAIFGDPSVLGSVAAARAPNVFIQPNLGVIYSGSHSKIAEHGGGSLDDTHVALLVSLPGLANGKSVSTPVTTTQVAPSILEALKLNPGSLQAVVQEGTTVLPSLF